MRQLVSVTEGVERVRSELNRRSPKQWRDLSAKANVSYRWVRYFAAGGHEPTLSRVASLSETMGCPMRVCFPDGMPRR